MTATTATPTRVTDNGRILIRTFGSGELINNTSYKFNTCTLKLLYIRCTLDLKLLLYKIET